MTPIEICPSCGQEAQVLITNIENGQQFCHQCAATVCPTFAPGLVYNLEDVRLLRASGVDPQIGNIENYLKNQAEHCKRPSGNERAWFRTREEAEAFAQDPANHPAYFGDIAHECHLCGPGIWHLSRPDWLEPQLTHQDGAMLELMGIEVPGKVPGDLKCANCGVEFRTGIDFLILKDGKMVCGTNCTPHND